MLIRPDLVETDNRIVILRILNRELFVREVSFQFYCPHPSNCLSEFAGGDEVVMRFGNFGDGAGRKKTVCLRASIRCWGLLVAVEPPTASGGKPEIPKRQGDKQKEGTVDRSPSLREAASQGCCLLSRNPSGSDSRQ